MTPSIDSLPTPVPFTGLPRLRCLIPLGDLKRALREGPVVPVSLDGTPWLIHVSLIERADAFSVERLHRAGLELLARVAHDRVQLGRCGFDEAWEAAFRTVLEAMYRCFRTQQSEGFQAQVERRLEGGADEEARALVRRVHLLFHSGGLRGYFSLLSDERASRSGLLTAIWEILSKARMPALSGRVRACGVTQEMLGRLEALYDELNQLNEARAQESAARGTVRPLRLLKAMVMGDLQAASIAARSELPEVRWQGYQLTRLLDVARQERREEQGPEPTGAATDPLPSDTPPPTAGVTPPPGTVLSRMEASGGPAVVAIVQPDGRVTWVPETELPAPPPCPAPPPPPPVDDLPPRRARPR